MFGSVREIEEALRQTMWAAGALESVWRLAIGIAAETGISGLCAEVVSDTVVLFPDADGALAEVFAARFRARCPFPGAVLVYPQPRGYRGPWSTFA